MINTNHLSFKDLIRVAQGVAHGKKRLHLLECRECSKGFLFAKALVGKWKRQGNPISILLGEITQKLNNLTAHGAIASRETIGDREILGVEFHPEQMGFTAQIVSDIYEVSGLWIKIYKLTHEKSWTEYKSATADEEGFAFLEQLTDNSAKFGHERYVAAIHGTLSPRQRVSGFPQDI